MRKLKRTIALTRRYLKTFWLGVFVGSGFGLIALGYAHAQSRSDVENVTRQILAPEFAPYFDSIDLSVPTEMQLLHAIYAYRGLGKSYRKRGRNNQQTLLRIRECRQSSTSVETIYCEGAITYYNSSRFGFFEVKLNRHIEKWIVMELQYFDEPTLLRRGCEMPHKKT
jgi:hypothetical protein